MKSGRTLLESRAENKGLRRTFRSRTFSLPALFEQLGDQTCPAGLVAGAETRAVVTVKALVKQNQVPPERVPLKLFGAAVDGPPAVRAAQENSGQPAGKLFGDLPQRLHLSRAGGELYGNFVAVVEVEPLQGFDEQEVHREPHRAAPIGIAAEEARRGLRGLVVNAVFVAVEFQHVRVVAVVLGKRADSAR